MLREAAGVLLLLLLPLLVLHPAVLGDQVFLPFDDALFPPASLTMDPAELDARRAVANFDITEKNLTFRLELELAQDELRAGRLPTWNPYVRGGAPLFATTLAALAHPPNLPHLLMPPERAFVWTAWINLAACGLLTLGLLRQLRLSPPAALLGALACTWSTGLTTKLHFYMMHAPLCWLPGMLWALVCLGQRPYCAAVTGRLATRRAVVALALTTALVWTAGFPPYAVAGSLLAGLALVVAAAARVRTSWRAARDLLLCGGAGLLLGLLLAAVQLLPMLHYFPHSQIELRQPAEALAHQGLDPAAWPGLLLPNAFSTPALHQAGTLAYDRSPLLWLLCSRAGVPGADPLFNFTECSVYGGALPAVLALAGLCGVGAGLPWRWWHALGLALFLVLATGGPVTAWLYGIVPVIGATQPLRFIGVVPLLWATLAATAFQDQLGAGDAPRRRSLLPIVLAVSLAVLALLGVVWLTAARLPALESQFLRGLAWRWPERFAALGEERVRQHFAPAFPAAVALLRNNLAHAALGLALAAGCLLLLRRGVRQVAWLAVLGTGAELVLLARPIAPSSAPLPVREDPVHGFLRRVQDEHAGHGGFMIARVAPTDAATSRPAPELPTALPPNLAMSERIRDLNALGLMDRRSHLPFRIAYGEDTPPVLVREFWLLALPDDERLRLPLLDLFGVRYLLSCAPPGRLPVEHGGVEVLSVPGHGGETFRVHERQAPCPRAFVATRTAVLDGDDAVARALASSAFEPREVALLTGDQAARLPELPDRAAAGGEVRFVTDTPTRLVLDVPDSPGGLLVLTDTWFPGWDAWVDGKPAPLVRADLCFRAVPVPEGHVVVELRYRAPGLLLGAALSLVALLVCGLVLWSPGSRRR